VSRRRIVGGGAGFGSGGHRGLDGAPDGEEAVMGQFACPHCGRPTVHLNISRSAELAQVTRTTVHAWMQRGLVHWIVRPSGRRLICANSLLRPA
jgi:hypothetical protein